MVLELLLTNSCLMFVIVTKSTCLKSKDSKGLFKHINNKLF